MRSPANSQPPRKAQLNIIDCAAYALARTRNLPLLYKGGDFAATDIEPALLLRR